MKRALNSCLKEEVRLTRQSLAKKFTNVGVRTFKIRSNAIKKRSMGRKKEQKIKKRRERKEMMGGKGEELTSLAPLFCGSFLHPKLSCPSHSQKEND